MRISFTEPVSPRYIHINRKTNRVHLLVPIVGGQEISTDNTCKSTAALDEFFTQQAALSELNKYKSALESDLLFLEDSHPLKAPKESRLYQINAYIKAVSSITKSYPAVISSLIKEPSNLYSIQLRPRAQDSQSRAVNPVFSINRQNDTKNIPASALYNAMHKAYPSATITTPTLKASLTQAVLTAITEQDINFETIQRVLEDQCQQQFASTVDFNNYFIRINGKAVKHRVTQAHIDALMSFGEKVTPEEYIDALLNLCALHLWIGIPTAHFYSIPEISEEERTEQLSILTQFFLAQVNVYCAAKNISKTNFGKILDKSQDLSNNVVGIVLSALGRGFNVEECLCTFFNEHQKEFGLARSLNLKDIDAIKQKFTRTYTIVTATKENPHMDDFMILDATTATGKFVTHQGSICTDFSELLVDKALDNHYFQTVRAEFRQEHDCFIPSKNESVQAASIDLSINELISRFKDDSQFEKLPHDIKAACISSPVFKLRNFLHDVAKGKQDDAETLLTTNPEVNLLLQTGTFTDYSGRTFTCTAYEYAYWAKDKHMCRMLEKNMDAETKVAMLKRIDAIDAVGLMYEQHGKIVNGSKHFDMIPFIKALEAYVNGYDEWHDRRNWVAMEAAWMAVGLAQRDVPAHVAQEYCRAKRSFDPTPEFDEDTLPRSLTFINYKTGANDAWFPLVISSRGLGVAFTLVRGGLRVPGASLKMGAIGPARVDLAAIIRLDEVRTADLALSRENLKPTNVRNVHETTCSTSTVFV